MIKMEQIKKLNIGCGYDKREGFLNIDKAKEVNPDMVVDIENGLPFPDNMFNEIYSEHCLEHITPDKWRFVLNEIARVSKDGCVLELDLPFHNWATMSHPDHFRVFGFASWDQYIKGNQRNYYSNLVLERIEPKPNKLYRLFFNLFPMFKYSIHYKFKVIK